MLYNLRYRESGNMLTPYEIIVKTALPAIRSMIARDLTEKYKLKQKEIANLMHITQAAVSYYLTHSRGKYIKYLEGTEINTMIDRLSDKIYKEKPSARDLILEINKIIIYMMKNKYLCTYHELLEPDINEEECGLCDEILKNWNS